MEEESKAILVKVKWGVEKYEIEILVNETVGDLKVKIYSLTTVPMEKQKVMYKGSTLKNVIKQLKLLLHFI